MFEQVDAHLFPLINAGREGGQEVQLSNEPEQVAQSGWQDVQGAVELDWKVPAGQLERA